MVSLDIKLTLANLGRVTERRLALEELKQERFGESRACFAQLDRLWERLKTPADEREALTARLSGLSEASIDVRSRPDTRTCTP